MSKIGIIKIKNIFARLFVSIKLRKHQPKTGLGIFTTKEEFDYLDYIHEHRNNVKKVWSDFLDYPNKPGCTHLDCCDLFQVGLLVNTHDDSKFTREEFHIYRNYFFPMKNEKKNKEKFDTAWNHHQKTNPHHWQYWIMWKNGESKAIPMSLYYAIEMIIDWTAMSYKFKDTPQAFYDKNKSTMMLHDKTREYIDRFLPTFNELAKRKLENE